MPDLAASLPLFLRSVSDLRDHIETHFEGLNSPQRGEAFLLFALKALQFVDREKYANTEANPKRSHDGGVDFFAQTATGIAYLAGQSKYKLSTVEELDSIISKFSAFEKERVPKGHQTVIFKLPSEGELSYCICTGSKLTTIVEKYKKRRLASRAFFDQLENEKRLSIVDASDIYAALRKAYQQTFIAPDSLDLPTATEIVNHSNVYLTIVTGKTLQLMFDEHGPSLFFENIREFLGFEEDRKDRQHVNSEILSTLSEAPDKMLERNNGVVLRASNVEKINNQLLRLTDPGIVNGCQTTMCIVHAGPIAADAVVPAKIVVSNDAWEIAKAANHQNIIHRVDLELARFVRPQIVRKVALESGYSMESPSTSLPGVLDNIYQNKTSHDEVRHLSIGMFSRRVTNLFNPRYEWVRLDVLSALEDNGQAERMLTVLLQLLAHSGRASRAGAARLPQHLQELFKRFFERASYRAFVAILAAAGIVEGFHELGDAEKNEAYEASVRLADSLDMELVQRGENFELVYRRALSVILEYLFNKLGHNNPENKMLQLMHSAMVDADFSTLRNTLIARMTLE